MISKLSERFGYINNAIICFLFNILALFWLIVTVGAYFLCPKIIFIICIGLTGLNFISASACGMADYYK